MDRHPIRAKGLVANRGERNRYSRIPRNQPYYSDGSSNPSLPFILSPSLTVHPSTNNRSNTMVDTDTDDARYPPDFVILIRERTMSHNIRYGWIRRAGISHKHANYFQSKRKNSKKNHWGKSQRCSSLHGNDSANRISTG